MVTQLRIFVVSCLVIAGGLGRLMAAENPISASKPDEASDVLERFLGNWKTKIQIRHVGPPARELTTVGTAVCKNTLGGAFFEFRSGSIPPGESDLQVMTYDNAAKRFRQWVFSSDGYTHTAEGTWDQETSTLRWKGKSDEATFVIEDRWVSPDRLDWTLRRTNAQGEVIQTISGTVTRAGDEH
jgi:hypothetical protein